MMSAFDMRHERRVDRQRAAFDAAFRREPRERLERRDVLGPAIGIARVVDRVHADDDLVGVDHLGQRQRRGSRNTVLRAGT